LIHVIGDLIIDEYWTGNVNRLSPEAPVPIVNLINKRSSLGGAGNVFTNIRAATNDVLLHGYKDHIHNYIFETLKVEGKLEYTEVMPHKTRIMSNQYLMSRIDHEKPIKETIVEDQFEIDNPYDLVVLSDYNKGTIKNPQTIIQKAKRCIVDPKKPLEEYRGAWVLKPNKKEFEEWTGKELNPKQVLVEARRARDELNVEHFLVTLGPEGVVYVGDYIEHYPAIETEVYDVTGAGDTFTAALALCCFMNMHMYQSIIVANTMAGQAVKHQGTTCLDNDELDKEIKRVIENEHSNHRSQGVHRSEHDDLFEV
tara:strand:+ start:463 stop:1395 length:933 start_codon:yes stop_codon:yes gene_type:complete